MTITFIQGHRYSREDVYKILNVPKERQKGIWNTGYICFEDNYYIFCNVGVAGRTGHEHKNKFVGDRLDWHGKKGSHINQPTIKGMISEKSKVHIFTRKNSSNVKFTYMGEGLTYRIKETIPVNITWEFKTQTNKNEENIKNDVFYEGTYKTVKVNAYERNKKAREECLKNKGYNCVACKFDFFEKYGDRGKNFIHVHHIVPISEINKEYSVDPIKDLVPICPNCHAMIHRGKDTISIEELKKLLKNKK